jgi:hypothetical protein
VVHEGGTGGFSAYVAIAKPRGGESGDRGGGATDRGRAVVLLSDTAVHSLGGLGDLGLHLLDPTRPLRKARTRAHPAAELVQSLIGRYRLDNGLGVNLTAPSGTLFVQADGQRTFELAFDSAGDFYPLSFDALLTPARTASGARTFTWTQGGGRMSATRVPPAGDRGKPASVTHAPTAPTSR